MKTPSQKFYDMVAELIRADEDRRDTSVVARQIREYMVDELDLPDPLGHIESQASSS